MPTMTPEIIELTNRRFMHYKPDMFGRAQFTDYIWRDMRTVELEENVFPGRAGGLASLGGCQRGNKRGDDGGTGESTGHGGRSDYRATSGCIDWFAHWLFVASVASFDFARSQRRLIRAS